jgi:hypothetical protein
LKTSSIERMRVVIGTRDHMQAFTCLLPGARIQAPMGDASNLARA